MVLPESQLKKIRREELKQNVFMIIALPILIPLVLLKVLLLWLDLERNK